MRIAVVTLCALCSASTFAQGGRAGTPPPPPATETVAPGIPGVVAKGAKVTIVKDGMRSSEGPIAMPDGTTLVTEPGASRVYKIDKSGAMTVFLEKTGRANGLALDSKGRVIATTAVEHRGAAPHANGYGKNADATERPRRRQERRGLVHAAERQTLSGVLHCRPAASP